MSRLRSVALPPALAVLFAAVLCAIALLISGDSPWTALVAMVTQVGQGTTAVDVVNSGAIYYLAALAVAIGFQMKLFNIGVEGQFRLAACVAAIVGGAVIPLAQGALADGIGIQHAFVLPALCYLYIAFYGFVGSRPAQPLPAEG